MNGIKYIKGDLFQNLPTDKNIVISHVCNNLGKIASGFVVPLIKKWPKVKEEYLKNFKLGNVNFVEVEPNITVANMISQVGLIGINNKRPLKYDILVDCMKLVGWYTKNHFLKGEEASIYAPKFGSLRSGGNWSFIEELINDIWITNDIKVTIFEYKE